MHKIHIYDNAGKTADRYTVVYMDEPEHKKGLYSARGMSAHPFHPLGIGEYCTAMPGKHLGKRISFNELPEDCQKLVLQDLTDESGVVAEFDDGRGGAPSPAVPKSAKSKGLGL